mgnify:FL=1
MRKILVRWDSPDGTATVCAERVGEHQLLPSHLVLYNVQGMAESSFPAVTIDTLAIKREEISYMAEGNQEEEAKGESVDTVEQQSVAPVPVEKEKAEKAQTTEQTEEKAEVKVPTDSVKKQTAGEQSENGANNSVIRRTRPKRNRRTRSRNPQV